MTLKLIKLFPGWFCLIPTRHLEGLSHKEARVIVRPCDAAQSEDYALSPHALAAAYLAVSGGVTSAVVRHDERGASDVHLTLAARQLCVCLDLPVVFEDCILPVAAQHVDVAARAQTPRGAGAALPAKPFECNPSIWAGPRAPSPLPGVLSLKQATQVPRSQLIHLKFLQCQLKREPVSGPR